jgi:trigger factor
VKSSVEPLEGNKVKVSVEIDSDEFDKAVDAAFRKISQQVQVPGFRKGKAPRKVLEARFGGPGFARDQALQDSLPEYYAEAVRTHEVDVIAPPEIDITAGAADGPVAFDAVVQIRPSVSIDGYQALTVTIPRPDVSDDDVAERIDGHRRQHSEFEAAARPAEDGDQVLIDIAGTQNGEALDGLTAADYLYEVGSGAVVAEIDQNLRGAKAGDTVTFTAQHPEGEDDLEFEVVVKEVRGSVLPELSDAWVAETTDFSTVEELRDSVRAQLDRIRRLNASMAMQNETAAALAELVTDEIPEPMIDNEISSRIQNLAQRLRQQNLDLNRYLQITGQSPETLVEQFREPATQAVKTDLALRAIAEAEGLDAEADDLAKYFDNMARQFGLPAEELAENFERGGQLPAVRSDVRKGKALDWVLDRVTLVDDEGNPIDRDELRFADDDQDPTDADPAHDHAAHDHDHDSIGAAAEPKEEQE